MMLKKPGHIATLSIPDHRTLKIGLLRNQIRTASISPEEFLRLLGR